MERMPDGRRRQFPPVGIGCERAGVSIGTVDRVLHDRPYVKAEVRIVCAADWQPSLRAPRPVRGSGQTVGNEKGRSVALRPFLLSYLDSNQE